MVASSVPVTPHLWVGVDIAAATFTAAWVHGEEAVSKPRTYPQHPHGFAALQTDLQARHGSPAETVVVMEATGSY